MRIAIVLYGQPRDYLKGHRNISEFIKKQKDCTFDFFFHCWTLSEQGTYKHSPWRTIDPNDLVYEKNTRSHLEELYAPIACEFEDQDQVILDESIYTNTLALANTKGAKLPNVRNTLYQMYSRNKARNLVKTSSVHYDCVVMVRFDIHVMPSVDLRDIDTTKTYVSNIHCPRKITPDNCIIAPTDVFLTWFTVYDDLRLILNNNVVMNTMKLLGEQLEINPEEVLLAKYLFHYNHIDDIRYFRGGTM
jgi:hypothetical protein